MSIPHPSQDTPVETPEKPETPETDEFDLSDITHNPVEKSREDIIAAAEAAAYQ